MRALLALILTLLLSHSANAAVSSLTLSVPSFVDKDENFELTATAVAEGSPFTGYVYPVRNGEFCGDVKTYNASPLVWSVSPNVEAGQNILITGLHLGNSTYGAIASPEYTVTVTDLPDISVQTGRIFGPLTQTIRFTATNPLSNLMTLSATSNKSYVGSSTDNGDGTIDISVVPLLGNVGETITFNVTATDSATGFYRTQAFPVYVWRLPVPVLDTFTAYRNTQLDVPANAGLLVNDLGDDVTPEVVSQPSHGTLNYGVAGQFTYDPDTDWVGVDTFTYRLVAPGGYTTGTVVVTITTELFGG